MEKTEYIFDITQNEFKEKVIDASSSTLVLVDFWAPWCGPCKQLTPLLEKIIKKAKGKVILIKINLDESQEIAGQLKIQSIPAVFAFKDGQPIDAFQGVIPEKKIIEFIEKSLGEKIEKDHTKFYLSSENLISNKKFQELLTMLEEFLAEHPDEFRAHSLYIDCLCSLNMDAELKSYTESLTENAIKNEYIQSSFKKIEMIKKNTDGPSLEELLNKLKNNPKKFEILEKLADKYFLENQLDKAFELLLNNYAHNKDKIKNKMINFFEILGNDNDKTKEYRKKLSSIIFS